MKLEVLFVFILFAAGIAVTEENNKQDSSGYVISNPFSQSKFVPDISLIIDASYLHHNLKDEEFGELESPGFIHSHHSDEHAHSSLQNGFNFNYGELYVASTVDPYFDLMGIFHLTTSSFEIEEGYFTTRSLPMGFQIKGGKFYSGFGKLNEQHAHIWDFADQPLIYKVFFGPEGLNETGIQLNWVAPTNFLFLIGTEIFQGENEASFGTEGFSTESVEVTSSNAPNLFTSFLRTSFDTENLAGMITVSGAFGKTRINHGILDEIDGDALYANTKILCGSVTAKYFIDPVKSMTFQSEFLYRMMKGDNFTRDSISVYTSQFEKNQSGFYAQLIYKFAQRWRAGIRYELLYKNELIQNSIKINLPDMQPRYSAMLDFNPSEFSRIRLQYNYDKTKYSQIEGVWYNKVNNELMLQINLAIGAHGAHLF